MTTTPKESTSSHKKSNPLERSLGIAKDGVLLSKKGVSAGFGIAHACVDASFALPKKCGLIKPPVELAHSITRSSLQFSSMIAHTSLEASDRMLTLVGAEHGETYKLLQEYVDSQSHTDGHDTRQALLGVSALLVEVGLELDNPLELIQGAQKLALVHEERRRERIAKRQEENDSTTKSSSTSLYMQYATAFYGAAACCGCVLNIGEDLVIPHPSELTSLSRHMRFAAAAYGTKSLKFMGVCDSLAYWSSDKDAIVTLCGIQDKDILYMAHAYAMRDELYCPAHYVAVDHTSREVVIAIRGTMSIHDVLVDLVCQSETFESVYDHDTTCIQGKAHGGFLKSAQTLASDLHELVAETLRKYPDYQLVICGHSLGGGVATLLALLWARVPEFRQHNVKAISYASPCAVCSKISQAPFTRRHVTSVVTGDDIVSRFSLSTFRELQQNMMEFANNDENESRDASMDAEQESPPPAPHDESKLYCAGRVWWLESKEYEPHPIVEVDPVKELYEIGLFPDMFAIHLPKAYLDSLQKLDERHDTAIPATNAE